MNDKLTKTSQFWLAVAIIATAGGLLSHMLWHWLRGDFGFS